MLRLQDVVALAVLVGSLLAPRVIAAQACSAPSTNPSSHGHPPLGAGSYQLTVVATSGSRAGARATGELQLRRSLAADGRSWRAGRGTGPDTAERPLIGYTLAPLRAVGAPLAPPDDTLHPGPESRHPTYPGVVVPGTDSEAVADVRLLIGTLFNRRDSMVYLDGAGIVLTVVESQAHEWRGHWDAFGIVQDGKGYFCLQRAAP